MASQRKSWEHLASECLGIRLTMMTGRSTSSPQGSDMQTL
jgi:hypothetical protein